MATKASGFEQLATPTRLSTAKQLADHLRQDLKPGHWQKTMPGVMHLPGESGDSRASAEAALIDFKQEGLLRCRAVAKAGRSSLTEWACEPARSGWWSFLFKPADRGTHYIVELLHALRNPGHDAEYAPKTQSELSDDPPHRSLGGETSSRKRRPSEGVLQDPFR